MGDDGLGKSGTSLGHLRYAAAALMVFGCIGIPSLAWRSTADWATGYRILVSATLMLLWFLVTFAIANYIITLQINYAKKRWPDDPEARRNYVRKSRRPPDVGFNFDSDDA